MTKVSFVIPHGPDPHRDRLLEWNKLRLASFFPHDEIIVATKTAGVAFNRGRLINYGASLAEGEYLCILDGDTVFNSWQLIRALRWMRMGAPWMIPYDEYYRTDERTGKAILANGPTALLWRDGKIRDSETGEMFERGYDHIITYPPTGFYQSPQSGMILFRTADFLDMGGFNERFEGWGYEDRGLVYAADTLIGPHHRISGAVFHLWHPESHETTEGQPNIEANRQLAEQMAAAQGNRELMRELNNG